MYWIHSKSRTSWPQIQLNLAGTAAICLVLAEFVTGQTTEFEQRIRPLFLSRCVECHGPTKQEGGLRLDFGSLVLKGGDSGPVINKEDNKASLLIQRVAATNAKERMPPEGPALSAQEVETIRVWIARGAVIPNEEQVGSTRKRHWSFESPDRPSVPSVSQAVWANSAIDSFVQAKLEGRGISPSPRASQASLLRRLFLDLLGLLPPVETVEAFDSDSTPDAMDRLIDQLLASPAYGERWGRHWLDQARYADSNGYTRDFGREIWVFREWVIRAVNEDKPFDTFTIEQIAGDLLPSPNQDQQVATGFHRNTLINEEGGTDQEQFRIDAVADRVATTGSVWLGLTLGCARCHNHKYDPISQREFYQFFAFLNNCEEPTLEAPSSLNLERKDLETRSRIREQIAELNKQLEAQRTTFEAKQREWESSVTPEQRSRLPGPTQVAFDMPFDKRDPMNKKTIEDHYRGTDHAKSAFPVLERIAALKSVEPKIPATMVLTERKEPRRTHIHKRGDFLDQGARVEPDFPALLHGAKFRSPSNRLDLARWLIDAANPLTPRVTANRSWMRFFGKGLVETDDDFGVQGSIPTHPELLDWLAVELSNSDGASPQTWSMKRFHRLIVLSATYQQSSRQREDTAAIDPGNDLLARQPRLRVEAEIVRDAALSASGLLNQEIGGPSVQPPQPDGVYAFTQDPKPWVAATNGDRFRRGMYTFFWRSLPYPMLTTFDAPNANVTCTRRLRSNTPLQALTLANDVVFVECAQALARRIVSECSADPIARAKFAFRACLARAPSEPELEQLTSFTLRQLVELEGQPEAARAISGAGPAELSQVADLAAWTVASRVLLNLDEFITRE